jgi:oligoribonuclease NrnB/cAMP/cGMP phosphodiesterase (DHH superfamily)
MKYYGSKAEVYHGVAKFTKGELTKKDIIRVNDGYGNYRYKSKKQQTMGKKKNSFIKNWAKMVKKAKTQLKKEGMEISGFVPVGGKSKEGKALLKRTKELMKR